FALTFVGNFDGVDDMSGFILGGGCSGTLCPVSFTRGNLVPSVAAPIAPGPQVSPAEPARPLFRRD
ncbi:MAG: hypothetical protein JSU87_16510, partial [Gemmatimonadota bacterium]